MIRYLSNTPDDIRVMLKTIGVEAVEDLFRPVPDSVRLKAPLNLPRAHSEPELLAYFRDRARANRVAPAVQALVGAGVYFHYIPAVVWDVLAKPEFYTAYTPYQPELSQGTLQAIFEFQTYVCLLTAMDVANASLYDGASALAEAVLMADRILRGRGRHVLIARSVHPEYRQTVRTYLNHLDIEIEEIPFRPETGRVDRVFLAEHLRPDTLAVVVQSPNFFGVIEDLDAVRTTLGEHPAIKIAVFTEALSLGLLKPPGASGFDIVVGEGQSLGVPMNYGGPHVGLMATREEYVRRMPGRIAGVAYDENGRRGFVLTLTAREQHIRRERATSNICTNQNLCALAVTVYLALLGPEGLQRLAAVNTQRAHYLAGALARAPGVEIAFRAPFFNEYVIRGPGLKKVWEQLQEENCLLGLPLDRWYPELEDHLLVTVTEMHEPRLLDTIAERFTRLMEEQR